MHPLSIGIYNILSFYRGRGKSLNLAFCTLSSSWPITPICMHVGLYAYAQSPQPNFSGAVRGYNNVLSKSCILYIIVSQANLFAFSSFLHPILQEEAAIARLIAIGGV